MAGYWPSSFSAFFWTNSKSIKMQEKRMRPISTRSWLIKDLLQFMVKTLHQRISLLREQRRLSRVGKTDLACSGSQSEHRICFIFPAQGTSHIINKLMILANYM